MNFSDVLKELLIEKEINIQILSKDTGIDDSVLYDYVYGSIPQVKFAMILANYFNCSLNYLMGLDDKPNSFNFKTTYDISLFSNRYDKLLEDNKVSHYKICREKHLNYSSHYSWRRGSIPSMSSLIIIANYFDTSIDYLIGRTDLL